MDYSNRITEWEGKFFKHLEETNPDLTIYFYTNVFFSPDVMNPNILHAGFNPVKDFLENKEIAERMFIVFEEFWRDNKA